MINELGERIKTLRKSLNMSQKELGNIVGLHNSNIGRIENGTVYPTADILLNISNVFHVSCDWLLTGKEFDSKICNNADEFSFLTEYRKLSDSDKTDIAELVEYKLYKASKEKRLLESSTSHFQNSAS